MNEPLLRFGDGDYRKEIRPSDFDRPPRKLPPFKGIHVVGVLILIGFAWWCLQYTAMH